MKPRKLRGLGVFLGIAAMAAVFFGFGTASGDNLRPGCSVAVTVQKFKPWSAKVWSPQRWRRGMPPKATIKEQRHKLHCAASASHRKAMKRVWFFDQNTFFAERQGQLVIKHLHEEIVAYTPYKCGSAGRFAVPCEIVRCESGYDWSATNPSGARGPYQLLDHGEPWPVTGIRDKLAHHEIARALYEELGTSPWVSSEECWG